MDKSKSKAEHILRKLRQRDQGKGKRPIIAEWEDDTSPGEDTQNKFLRELNDFQSSESKALKRTVE